MAESPQDALAAIVGKETWSAEDHSALIKQLFAANDAPQKFRAILGRMEAADPDPKGGAALRIGIARYMLCRFNAALEVLANATDNKDRRYFQGLCCKQLQQYDKAAEEFDRARARGWEGVEIDLELIEVRALSGRLEDARKGLDQLSRKWEAGVEEEEITPFMREHFEFKCVPVHFPPSQAQKLWEQVLDVLQKGRRQEGDSDLKGLLLHLEDRLMLEYPDPAAHPKTPDIPRFNDTPPKATARDIRKAWRSDVPEDLRVLLDDCIGAFCDDNGWCNDLDQWKEQWGESPEKLKALQRPGLYVFRQRNTERKDIVYVGMAGEGEGGGPAGTGLSERVHSHYNVRNDNLRKEIRKLLIRNAGYHYLSGLIAELAGYGDRAAARGYQQARSIDPAHSGATFRLAYYYDLHGEEDQAVELYKECVFRPPVYANALLNLAVLNEDAGRYDMAIACLKRILATNPNHARARLFLRDAQASKTMYYDEDQARRIARRNAVLDIPVTDFELSVRARNCLKKMNIRTLGDLVRTTEAELLAYKNFGETSLKEIKDMLAPKGLRLGQAIEEGDEEEGASRLAPAAAVDNQGVLGTPIDSIDFSIRARRALQSLKVTTLGDLAGKTEAELLACKNFGQTSLNEIRQRLAEYGLRLREPDG